MLLSVQVREKDWCNAITGHQGDSAAYTWRLQNFTLGQNVLRPPVSKKRKAEGYPEAPVTAVAMSQCGNYGLVGRANGSLDRYNMQSGLHRGSYVRCTSTRLNVCSMLLAQSTSRKRRGRGASQRTGYKAVLQPVYHSRNNPHLQWLLIAVIIGKS